MNKEFPLTDALLHLLAEQTVTVAHSIAFGSRQPAGKMLARQLAHGKAQSRCAAVQSSACLQPEAQPSRQSTLRLPRHRASSQVWGIQAAGHAADEQMLCKFRTADGLHGHQDAFAALAAHGLSVAVHS